MRIAFLTLAAANILFLAWAHWVDAPSEATAQDALSHLPRLQLVTEAPLPPKPEDGSVQKMALREPETVEACTSVGPFNDMESASRTASMLIDRGFKSQERAELGETVEGYWVYVSGMKTDDEVARVVDKLDKSGFTDAHVMKESSSAGRRVSVGLFSKRERAERRVAAVEHMGLKPEIGERKFPGTVYWVDVTLQPGVHQLSTEGLLADSGQTMKVGTRDCPQKAAPLPIETAAPAPGHAGSEEADGIMRSLPRTTVASAPSRTKIP